MVLECLNFVLHFLALEFSFRGALMTVVIGLLALMNRTPTYLQVCICLHKVIFGRQTGFGGLKRMSSIGIANIIQHTNGKLDPGNNCKEEGTDYIACALLAAV